MISEWLYNLTETIGRNFNNATGNTSCIPIVTGISIIWVLLVLIIVLSVSLDIMYFKKENK